MAVKRALEGLPGVQRAEVSFRDKEARVTFDPAVTTSSTWYTGTVHTNPAYDPQSADDTEDLGVVVFDAPIPGVTPATLPTESLLDRMGPQELSRASFNVVAWGVSRSLGGSDGGGKPLKRESGGADDIDVLD